MKITKKTTVTAAKYGTPDSPRRRTAIKREVKLTKELIEQYLQDMFDTELQSYPEYSFLQGARVFISRLQNFGTQYRQDIRYTAEIDASNIAEARKMYWSYWPIDEILFCYGYLPHDTLFTGDLHVQEHYIRMSVGNSVHSWLYESFACPEYIQEIKDIMQTYKTELRSKLLSDFPDYVADVRFDRYLDAFPYEKSSRRSVELDPQTSFDVFVDFKHPIMHPSYDTDFLSDVQWKEHVCDIFAQCGPAELQEDVNESIQKIYSRIKNLIYKSYPIAAEGEMHDAVEAWIHRQVIPAFNESFPGYDVDVTESDGKWYVEVLRDATHTYGGKPIRVKVYDLAEDNSYNPDSVGNYVPSIIKDFKRAFKYREKYYGDEESSENESDDLVTL